MRPHVAPKLCFIGFAFESIRTNNVISLPNPYTQHKCFMFVRKKRTSKQYAYFRVTLRHVAVTSRSVISVLSRHSLLFKQSNLNR